MARTKDEGGAVAAPCACAIGDHVGRGGRAVAVVPEAKAANLKRLRRIAVSEVMSTAGTAQMAVAREMPAVNPNDDLRRVATLFLEHGVDVLRCVDGEGRAVGVVTRASVAARLAATADGQGVGAARR